MEFLENIKERFFNSVLEQRGAFAESNRALMNFDTAKRFGIIYDSTVVGNDILITKTSEFLKNKGKEVTVMAFLNDKVTHQKADVTIFNSNDINWYGVPKSETVARFCNQPFDVLLCAYYAPLRPLEYIAHLSKSSCRVGIFDLHKTKEFELMIQPEKGANMQQILQSMITLLNQIKL
jgi:hypothetical protein